MNDQHHFYHKKQFRWIVPYINKAKQVSFPGFDRVPVFNVLLFFFRGIRDGRVISRAEAVSFNLVLAVFPAILFLFTLIPLIPIDDFQSDLLLMIQSILPASTYVVVQRIIEDIITIKHGGLLSFGFALAVVFSTNGIVALIDAFNVSIHVEEGRSWLMQRAVAFILMVSLVSLVTIGVSLMTITHRLMDFLVLKELMIQGWLYYMVNIGKWVVILGVFYFAYSFLYYWGPSKKSQYRFISAGASLATALSILITTGFGFYIDHFSRYNALYGSIGTLPIIMLMIFCYALAIIIGFELNIGIVTARKVHLTEVKS
ncbi:MAG: YihY/virulence factor BrkB family protein [Candidatus Marinimicrobia bacterium]|jgi:membrane protein|nr:YihY/virulence factor BrkB family protein [Candidatus Neomarinimicrobiota bacterium]MBT4714599.1 YihY/virulence factor BrkB family protein [Candidatus Neomarinimicrobiota bacterium]MBT4946358.1 YihY/virulence factor BrkB family protein [Candidatus Neomarinimicrobiota bacterium]MBT6010674.1 YihY/virulence factor BrkB family protein [Candidatus Neomarinimicrobiota bacterium]